MALPDILRLRLANQRVGSNAVSKPEDAVEWFGAVQAQDYLGSLWAIGLRTRGATEASVEAAQARRAIVRTWPMRGTLHFVAAEDARWITRLLAPRIVARNAARWQRDFGVTPTLLARADEVLTRALEGGKRLSRERLYEALDMKRIRTAGSRGLHLLLCLALQGRLCLAGREGKQQTFALLDEWIPASRHLESDAALAELALRYFTSHGPATQKDFMWWAGITAREATAALAEVRKSLTHADIDGVVHWWRESASKPVTRRSLVELLPAFDEYTVAYADRAVLAGNVRTPKMALLSPAVVLDGRVAGNWKRVLRKTGVSIAVQLNRRLNRAERAALHDAAVRYATFLGLGLSALHTRSA